jgi:hypothetical protein
MSIVLQGSTSGSVTLQEPAVAGTTVLTLPAVTGTVLTDTSPKAGNVLQVVNATYGTETSNATSTYADTGLTASITPTSSSSKILVLVNQAGCGKNTNNTKLQLRLLRNSTTIQELASLGGVTDSTATNSFGNLTSCYLDSPATTSSTTYKTQFASGANNLNVFIQASSGGVSSVSTITLLEIAA